jgi:hypothetical protein
MLTLPHARALLNSCAGNVPIVQALIAAGADVGAPNSFGETPVHLASRYGQSEVVKALLAGGASVSVFTSANFTPFHYAAGAGHIGCLKLLDKTTESKTGGKKDTKKDTKKAQADGKKGDKKTVDGGGSTFLPAIINRSADPATINTLSSSFEPPLLRAVTALGGRAEVVSGRVFKSPEAAGLSAVLNYCGSKYAAGPKPAKSAGAKEAGGKKGKK